MQKLFNFLYKNDEITDLQQNVKIGERYILHYKIPYLRSESAVNKTIRDLSIKPEYKLIKTEIIRHEGILEHDILLIEIEIRENPIPIAIVAYSIIAIAGASLLYLSLDKVYKITTDFKPLVYLGAGLLTIFLFKKWRID